MIDCDIRKYIESCEECGFCDQLEVSKSEIVQTPTDEDKIDNKIQN